MHKSIKNAQGTIYFIEDEQGLKQGYDIVIENPGDAFDGKLTVKWSGGEYRCDVAGIVTGESTSRVYIPDVREPVQMTFLLDGCELTIDHNPQRHWTVHVVQFSHHDLGYTDLPSNVLREHCGYLDSVLRFCRETDEFPEDSKFRYTIEQGWSLLYWLDNRPQEVRDEMMRRIKEGRVEITAFLGNMTTELLGPEEMIRLLYPVFDLKHKYDIPVVAAENNDIPGVSWGVAAVLAGAGIKYFTPGLSDYFKTKPSIQGVWDADKVVPGDRPHAFYWQAPNGEKVLFWHHLQGVGGDPELCLGCIPLRLEETEKTDYPYDIFRYLVIGGRRDNTPPKVEFAHTIRKWNDKWAYPKLVFSLNSIFFPELEKQLAADTPTWRGEIPGTDYSVGANSTAFANSLNRVAHDQLLAAERFAGIASILSPYSYPAEQISEAYYCMLMHDEHTWGYACPIGPGQEATILQLSEYAYRAAALSHDVLIKSINEIADRILLDKEGYHAVIFNPLDQMRTNVVTALGSPIRPSAMVLRPGRSHPTDAGGYPAPCHAYTVSNRSMVNIPIELIEEGFEIIDVSTGKTVPHEVYEITDPLTPSLYAPNHYAMASYSKAERYEVRFVAEDVPALGWKTYRFVPVKQGAISNRTPSGEGGVLVGANSIENRFYKVELDSATGAIKSIFDKELGRELIDNNAKHGVNQVVVRSSVTAEETTIESAKIKPGRIGPVSGSLIVKTSALGIPQITQEITLYSDIKRIDIANRILKDPTPLLEVFFAFPFAVDKPSFKYEGPLCVIEPFVDQFPGSCTSIYAIQHWADVSNDKGGVTLCSLDAPMMQFGGNWPLHVSPAHHGCKSPIYDQPYVTKDEVDKGYMYSLALVNNYRTNFCTAQSGDMLFRYSITSHTDGRDGRPRDFGYSASLPLLHAAVNGPQEGDLSVCSGFCRIDKSNVILLTLKHAEDKDGLIMRLLETEGRDTEVTITLPFITVDRSIETNLVEENLRPLTNDEHAVKVKISKWDTATLRIISQ